MPIALLAGALAACSGGGGGGAPAGASGTASSAPRTSAPAPVDPAATALMTRAQQAFTSVRTVHLLGNLLTGGEQILLDLRVVGSTGGQGLIVSGGQSIQIVRLGSTVWVRGDAVFSTRVCGATGAAALAGRWLQGPAGGFDKSLIGLTSVTGLAALLAPRATARRSGTATVKGVPVTQLSIPGTEASVLSIAATGRPLPIRLSRTSTSAERGVLDFADYDKPVALYRPPAASTVTGCPATASSPAAAPTP